MEIRQAQSEDFSGLKEFVADAIAEAFYRPGLNQAEIDSNQKIAEIALPSVLKALQAAGQMVFVATHEGELAGYLILSDLDSEMPELDWLMVGRKHQGKGVAQRLMDLALAQIPEHKNVKLGVIHYNQRAISFYEKYGFKKTGKISGNHLIPRILMVRPARMQK